MNVKFLLILFFCSLLYTNTDAQILKRVLKRTQDKVENMVVEKAADVMARALMRRINKEIDEALYREWEKQDSIAVANGETPAYPDYDSFLKGMNKVDEVPPAYEFDLQMHVTMSEKGKDGQDYIYHFGKEEGVFAMESEDPEEGKAIFLIDSGREIMVVYNEKDGKKTASALPSMMNFAGAYAQQTMDEKGDFSVKATGNSKEVAGYHCEEYEVSWDKESSLSYVARDFPKSWPEAFGAMMKKFMTEENLNRMDQMEGMALESHELDKKGKIESSWVTTKVNTETTTLNKSDYTFGDFSAQ
jgi:hypothetical protein